MRIPRPRGLLDTLPVNSGMPTASWLAESPRSGTIHGPRAAWGSMPGRSRIAKSHAAMIRRSRWRGAHDSGRRATMLRRVSAMRKGIRRGHRVCVPIRRLPECIVATRTTRAVAMAIPSSATWLRQLPLMTSSTPTASGTLRACELNTRLVRRAIAMGGRAREIHVLAVQREFLVRSRLGRREVLPDKPLSIRNLMNPLRSCEPAGPSQGRTSPGAAARG